MSHQPFPAGFLWGTATSSYQIEGAWNAHGKGESIWDRFSHTPGTIADGTNGDVACDHFHRWRDDIALMRSLGLQAYRFSIAWPRVIPEGTGPVNQAGLDFYSRLVDELLAADIVPFATLYHWDLPQALQDEGGWPHRVTAHAYARYADVVSRHLGDRLQHWITHNEPWVVAHLGYRTGEHAPGQRTDDWTPALRAAHHVLLSHGWAVPLIRANSPGSVVGIALNFTHAQAASSSAADLNARRQYDGYFNRWFLDPVYGRHYPADMVADYMAGGVLPGGLDFVQDGDYAAIAAPLDFLGVNYYTRAVVRGGDVLPPEEIFLDPPEARTEMNWELFPEGLYQLLNRLYFEYRIPRLYITENGASYGEGPDATGTVRDERRIAYLKAHFEVARRAIANDVPLAGYFVWSLMDNFEWAHGYRQRFGIVHVDYATQKRSLKDSALWYREFIAGNGLPE